MIAPDGSNFKASVAEMSVLRVRKRKGWTCNGARNYRDMDKFTTAPGQRSASNTCKVQNVASRPGPRGAALDSQPPSPPGRL
jgi:hypothetical protein